VAQVSLQRTGVDATICKLVATGGAQHMSVRLDAEVGRDSRTLDHAREARRRERRSALRHEHERRLRAFPLMPAQLEQISTYERELKRRGFLTYGHPQMRPPVLATPLEPQVGSQQLA
jgi:hypothetical protein